MAQRLQKLLLCTACAIAIELVSLRAEICETRKLHMRCVRSLDSSVKTLLQLHARLAEPYHLSGTADWLLDGLDQDARSQVSCCTRACRRGLNKQECSTKIAEQDCSASRLSLQVIANVISKSVFLENAPPSSNALQNETPLTKEAFKAWVRSHAWCRRCNQADTERVAGSQLADISVR